MNRPHGSVLALQFLTVLFFGVSAPAAASAQIPLVAILLFEPPAPGEPPLPPQLKELGQYEGRTYVVEARYVRGDNARFPALARELLDRNPALIVTTCGPAQRAIRKLNTMVPIIAGCADPRNFLGEVASLNRPGGRTTGFTFLAPDSAGKRLQLLKELLPRLSRVGVLHHRHDDWGTYFEEMDRARHGLGLTLFKLPIGRAADIDHAFAAAAKQRVEALVVFPDATTFGAAARIGALAIKHKLPTIFDIRNHASVDGALLAYGPDWLELASQAVASHVDKVLRGAAPGDLPIQQPTRMELVVNLRTAKALGLIVPNSILIRADEVVR
jgi:putative ABC transport system substrate-binding protein